LWMLEHLLAHPDSRLWCVDPWDGRDKTLGERTRAAEINFEHNLGPWMACCKAFKEKWHSLDYLAFCLSQGRRFDLIYIDGSHEGLDALTDIVMAYPLLRPDGWLVFDDYFWRSESPGVAGICGRCAYIHKIG
jgi:hypothetical protein